MVYNIVIQKVHVAWLKPHFYAHFIGNIGSICMEAKSSIIRGSSAGRTKNTSILSKELIVVKFICTLLLIGYVSEEFTLAILKYRRPEV